MTNRINIAIEKHNLVTFAVASFRGYIKNEVLADDLRLVETVAGGEARNQAYKRPTYLSPAI